MKPNDTISVIDMLSAVASRVGTVASKKAQEANTVLNREMTLAKLTKERQKLIYLLGEKVYLRIKGESDDQYVRRLEQIDKDMSALKQGTAEN